MPPIFQKGLKETTCHVYLEKSQSTQAQGTMCFSTGNSTFKLVRSYVSPLSSLSRLSIKWMDYAGNLIPFNGLPQNSFTLELVCEDRGKGW